ncbi:helix-turn-helix domain-containing protein [Brevibacillus brevis]|uniref:helix-turn-helix domain-containing protein n=1 Tax=Brevibacillus brevis TaxID=1393 RepID=UPI00165D37B1|nr:helix-turn-helix transcriptional regulator [Brevibacillus brevis]
MILKVRLKEVLEERGLTQKELSALTGLRENTISELSNNIRQSINVKYIGIIAKKLNITNVNEILYFEEDR